MTDQLVLSGAFKEAVKKAIPELEGGKEVFLGLPFDSFFATKEKPEKYMAHFIESDLVGGDSKENIFIVWKKD